MRPTAMSMQSSLFRPKANSVAIHLALVPGSPRPVGPTLLRYSLMSPVPEHVMTSMTPADTSGSGALFKLVRRPGAAAAALSPLALITAAAYQGLCPARGDSSSRSSQPYNLKSLA
jgi:hypothetical protein